MPPGGEHQTAHDVAVPSPACRRSGPNNNTSPQPSPRESGWHEKEFNQLAPRRFWDDDNHFSSTNSDPPTSQDVPQLPNVGPEDHSSEPENFDESCSRVTVMPWASQVVEGWLGMKVDGEVRMRGDLMVFFSNGVEYEATQDLYNWREVGGEWKTNIEENGDEAGMECIEIDLDGDDFDLYKFKIHN